MTEVIKDIVESQLYYQLLGREYQKISALK